MKQQQKIIWKLDLPLFRYSYQKGKFVNSLLNTEVLPIVLCSLLIAELYPLAT